MKDLGGYYFVCRPEKVTVPKVEAFRRWIVEAATNNMTRRTARLLTDRMATSTW